MHDFFAYLTGAECATKLPVVSIMRQVFGYALALTVAASVACASPTLPLPPPDVPYMTAGAAPGTVHLAGSNAESGAEVIVRNMNPAVPTNRQIGGAVVSPDGTWDAEVYASNGDVLTLTQQVGSMVSSPLVITVKF